MRLTTANFGFTTPVLTLVAKGHSKWETDGTVQDVQLVANAADRLGYDYLTCSEHVGIPEDVVPVRGGRYWDPLSIFGYLAATTERIKFATYVLVLAYNHPLAIVKRYGTLDRVCNGRVILGVGVGSLKPEFDLLGLGGVEFEERGSMGDDAIRAIRASTGRMLPEYDGPHFSFKRFVIDPCAPREHMPIWIGGRTFRSLRRAIELGDGWAPFGLSVDEMGEMIKRAQDLPQWPERAAKVERALRHDGLIDPMNKPDEAIAAIQRVYAAGATKVHLHFVNHSAAHFVEQLEATAALQIDV